MNFEKNARLIARFSAMSNLSHEYPEIIHRIKAVMSPKDEEDIVNLILTLQKWEDSEKKEEILMNELVEEFKSILNDLIHAMKEDN